jgi:hypothetical protein
MRDRLDLLKQNQRNYYYLDLTKCALLNIYCVGYLNEGKDIDHCDASAAYVSDSSIVYTIEKNNQTVFNRYGIESTTIEYIEQNYFKFLKKVSISDYLNINGDYLCN